MVLVNLTSVVVISGWVSRTVITVLLNEAEDTEWSWNLSANAIYELWKWLILGAIFVWVVSDCFRVLQRWLQSFSSWMKVKIRYLCGAALGSWPWCATPEFSLITMRVSWHLQDGDWCLLSAMPSILLAQVMVCKRWHMQCHEVVSC